MRQRVIVFFLVFLSLFVILELLFLKFYLYKSPAFLKNSSSLKAFLSPTSFSNFFKKNYRLQNVVVTSKDFEKKFSLYYPNTFFARSNPSNWRHIASILTEEAIILNEGIKKGIINPNENFLDPNKIEFAREYFRKEGTTYISGEGISVWFYNMKPPTMGVEAAKTKTHVFIKNLREKVVRGEITMKQAGEIIASYDELAEIDVAYKTNAYFTFEFVKPNQKLFNDPELNKILWQFEEGKITPILIGKDYTPSGWYEAYFIVIKINAKKIQEFDTIEQLIEKRKKEGLEIIL